MEEITLRTQNEGGIQVLIIGSNRDRPDIKLKWVDALERLSADAIRTPADDIQVRTFDSLSGPTARLMAHFFDTSQLRNTLQPEPQKQTPQQKRDEKLRRAAQRSERRNRH